MVDKSAFGDKECRSALSMSNAQEEHDFGVRELQYGQNILEVLNATDLNEVDKDALAGTLQAVNSHLANAMGSLR